MKIISQMLHSSGPPLNLKKNTVKWEAVLFLISLLLTKKSLKPAVKHFIFSINGVKSELKHPNVQQFPF